MSYVKALTKRENFVALAVVAMLAIMMLPLTASAQPTIDPGLIGNPSTATTFGITTLDAILTQVFNFVLVIAAAFVVIFLLWGGIAYLTSGGNEEKREAAKQRMITGVIGAAIILGIGVIIATLGSFLGGTVA